MPPKKKKPDSEPLLSLATVLFLIPAYLYFCSYQYERGLCQYYNIPKKLIAPDLNTNLAFCTSLFIGIFLFVILPLFILYVVKIFSNMPRRFYPYADCFSFAIVFGCIWYFGTPYVIDWFKTAPLILISAIGIGYVGFLESRSIAKKEQNNASKNTDEVAGKESNPSFNFSATAFRRMVLKNQLLFIVVLVMTAGLSFIVGEFDANNTVSYQVLTTKKNWVVLRKYGDNFITKNYDPQTKILGDSLEVVKVNETKLLMTTIGHLHSLDVSDGFL